MLSAHRRPWIRNLSTPEAIPRSFASRAAARNRATFSWGVSPAGPADCDGEIGFGSVVSVEELNAVGRDMACGCVEVKRVNVSDGARRDAIVSGYMCMFLCTFELEVKRPGVNGFGVRDQASGSPIDRPQLSPVNYYEHLRTLRHWAKINVQELKFQQVTPDGMRSSAPA